MNLQLSRQSILSALSLLVLTLFAASSTTFAQGVSSPTFTMHNIDPGPVVNIGSPTSPVPVVWSGTGVPWNKSINDPNGNFNFMGPATLNFVETLANAGTVAWTDWHEVFLPPPVGLTAPHWSAVVGLTVNGNPITYSATGIGTGTLDLFNFSQAVMPGDILGIHKQALVDGGLIGGGFLRLQEYPTVPEPATIALFIMGSLALTGIRRRR